jgi:hypothetical protein
MYERAEKMLREAKKSGMALGTHVMERGSSGWPVQRAGEGDGVARG